MAPTTHLRQSAPPQHQSPACWQPREQGEAMTDPAVFSFLGGFTPEVQTFHRRDKIGSHSAWRAQTRALADATTKSGLDFSWALATRCPIIRLGRPSAALPWEAHGVPARSSAAHQVSFSNPSPHGTWEVWLCPSHPPALLALARARWCFAPWLPRAT